MYQFIREHLWSVNSDIYQFIEELLRSELLIDTLVILFNLYATGANGLDDNSLLMLVLRDKLS